MKPLRRPVIGPMYASPQEVVWPRDARGYRIGVLWYDPLSTPRNPRLKYDLLFQLHCSGMLTKAEAQDVEAELIPVLPRMAEFFQVLPQSGQQRVPRFPRDSWVLTISHFASLLEALAARRAICSRLERP